MPARAMIDPGTDLIGRDDELARIVRCLPPGGDRALIIGGGRGLGKSRLLAAGVQLARAAGRHRVVMLHGSTGPALSPIRQLLLAVRHDLPRLPASIGGPALAFLGLHAEPETPRRLRAEPERPKDLRAEPETPKNLRAEPERPKGLRHGYGVTAHLGAGPGTPEALRSALRAAVAAIARSSPVLIAVDDVHHLAPETTALLARLAEIPSTVLLATSAVPLPAALTGLPVLELRPLGPPEAGRLLDGRANPPSGRTRAEILRRAAGNPAALTELGTAEAPEGSLQFGFAAEIGRLPAPTRKLLLHLATAPAPAEPGRVAAAAAVETAAWQPAERSGLVVATGDHVAFSHPLVAEAAYRAAPVHARRQAHRDLAPTATAERRAWHLAAASPGRDEALAAGLEAAAGVYRSRGELFEATAAMQEAAERSLGPESSARRFTQAVTDARDLGETGWAVELYATVRRLTSDPDLVTVAARSAATALSRSGRQHEAYGMLTAARRAGSPADRMTALTVAGLAAAIAGISGHEDHRLGLVTMLDAAAPAPDEVIATFVRLTIDPAAHPGRTLCDTTVAPRPGTPLSPPARFRLSVLGTIAWYEDRSRLAVDLLRAAAGELRAPRSFPPGTEALPVLVSALIDTGEWDEAERCAERAGADRLPLIGANLAALRAELHALRGDSEQALYLAQRTWQDLDIQENRSTHLRLLRAAALAAIGTGDYENGYRHLRAMFDVDGRALHPFLAAHSVADLAAAAARGGRRDDARPVVDQVRADAGAEPSTRMRLLLHLSEALLADGERAEHHFRLATVDPAGHEWPYERGLARLHYGEWLRRARRPREARAVLTAAAATFAELGATTAAGLADRELRAAGRPDEPAGRSPAAALTPQERQVALLAARGLRNREIAEQLFISVRTVGAHLYSVYPKLGISGRHQLPAAFPGRGVS